MTSSPCLLLRYLGILEQPTTVGGEIYVPTWVWRRSFTNQQGKNATTKSLAKWRGIPSKNNNLCRFDLDFVWFYKKIVRKLEGFRIAGIQVSRLEFN